MDKYNFSNVNTNISSRMGLTSKGNNPIGSNTKNINIRPITSNNGAKFGQTGMGFNTNTKDLLRETQTKMLSKDKENKNLEDPEKKIKKYELEINNLIDESNDLLYCDNKKVEALQKSKDAVTKMKQLEKYLETAELTDYLNVNLHYSAFLNLCCLLEANNLLNDAIQEYTKLLSSKTQENSVCVRVNMGNIYYKMGEYKMAIKMYKMVIDMLNPKQKNLKDKLYKNLANAYVKINEYSEAINVYSEIITKASDFGIMFNMILCLFSVGDKAKLKTTFLEMLSIETLWNDSNNIEKEDTYLNDELAKECTERRNLDGVLVLQAAKLIAPVIEQSIIKGYQWIKESLKNSKFQEVLSEIEICEAIEFVKELEIPKAIEILKDFEKKDKNMMARAATNLSFLYFLENDIKQSNYYSDLALEYDRFNSKALVNKGNCYFVKHDFIRAKEKYLEAIGIEADCIEALYNLAFVNKKINYYDEALIALEKLKSVVGNMPEVIYQIASIYELRGENKQALKWYDILLTIIQNEPNIHARLGALYSIENEEGQAYHHYMESFKLLPVNIDTIAWLGIHFVKNLKYEKACIYFEKASLIQPKDLKWKLMVASCFRRMENFDKAIKIYLEVHNEDPNNLESLRFLVQINQELGRPYEVYSQELKKLERKMEIEEGGKVDYIPNRKESSDNEVVNDPGIRMNNKNNNRVVAEADEDDNWNDDNVEEILGY